VAKIRKLRKIEVTKNQTKESKKSEPIVVKTEAMITKINGVENIGIKCPDCGIWLHLPLVTIRLLKYKRKHPVG